MSQPEAVERAATIVSQLAAGGVRHVVYCPGSRDAPFAPVLAAAERAEALSVHVRIDERSAAFFALGLARAGEVRGAAEPVALVMTSGTAVANTHPAVLEAAHACVPLVVVAADRPASMRGTGASQTTDHLAVLAGSVRGTWDVAGGSGAWASARALEIALGGPLPPGPVLLNVQLAPPLHTDIPVEGVVPAVAAPKRPDATEVVERLAGPGDVGRFIPVATAALAAPNLADLGLDASAPGLIIAGNQAHLSDGAADVPALSRACAWPLLAEPSSGLRLTPALTHYQQILQARPDLVAAVDQVLVVGHPTLSRPVTRLLTDPAVRVVTVARSLTYTDLDGAVAAVAEAVPRPPAGPDPQVAAWYARWVEADREVAPSDARERLAAALWQRLAARTDDNVLVVGASLAIRALDRAGTVAELSPTALANRGLAGIDGTVSFARGVSVGLGRPVRAVVGDVTFLHDVGGLACGLCEDDAEDVEIVVLNDAGGQIFRTLEYGASPRADEFRRFFLTPQRADIAALARGFGWEYAAMGVTEAREKLASAPWHGRRIVEVDLTGSA